METALTIRATITPRGAAHRGWDAIVVGAGPAGAFAARKLARTGTRVLLIDRQDFPRTKVCGGCLNRRTLSLLDSAGLGTLPASLGAEPINRFELRAAGGKNKAGEPLVLPVPAGFALSRTALDAALVRAAIEAGAEFLPGVRGTLGRIEGRYRIVVLPDAARQLRAGLVLGADGLAGSFLPSGSGHRAKPEPGCRLGAGAELRDESGAYSPGAIHMAVHPLGYAGVVRVESGRLSVAAALDREGLRAASVGEAVGRLLVECGLPPVDVAGTRWCGTGGLTRRAPHVALERVFLIGDAAGYVEPFTGEGISWALETAGLAAEIAVEAIERWHPDLGRRWQRLYRSGITRRQRWCRTVAWALRRPGLVRSAVHCLRRVPAVAMPLIAHLNAAPTGGAR